MLKIVKYPNSILKKKSEEVSRNDKTLRSLVPQMIEAMKKNQGIGLAAPQIGISKKIIIVTEGEEVHAFLNPRIVKQSKEKEQDEEGCLSLPGLFVKILRSKQVEVVAETLDGEEIRVTAQGLGARIFQHEIDHIEGKLIINRINPLLRWKLRHQLKNLVK
ncbi:MAG: peptide deformylase [Candidatus Wildermuthbacteria bacterium]|nr:peptide deformylase [Candidatus Wildermuthbacteria bacterium]